MLLHAQRVRIAGRQEGLQVLLDVVRHAQPLHHLKHAMGVVLPVGGLGHGQVVHSADLVQIDELVRLFDDVRTDALNSKGLRRFVDHGGGDRLRPD